MDCDKHGPMTGLELREVYDGVSAWICEACEQWHHRWPEGHPRRAKTEVIIRDTYPLKSWAPKDTPE